MKIIFFSFFYSALVIFPLSIHADEKLFKGTCASCHTIGKGKLVGPDLKNIHTKYEESWLLKWIKSSQTLIKQKDEQAVAVFKQYGEIPMPDNPQFSENDIKNIIGYIKYQSENSQVSNTIVVPSEGNVLQQSETTKSNSGKSGNTYLFVGIGLVSLFFLSIVIILMRSIFILTNELKNKS